MSIKNLRTMTGMPVAMCALAWKESNGVLDKAIEILKTKGLLKAKKLQDRATSGGGYIGMYRHHTAKVCSTVSLLCETESVSNLAVFRVMADEIAMHLATLEEIPETPKEFLEQELLFTRGVTIEEHMAQLSARVGEKIELGAMTLTRI